MMSSVESLSFVILTAFKPIQGYFMRSVNSYIYISCAVVSLECFAHSDRISSIPV